MHYFGRRIYFCEFKKQGLKNSQVRRRSLRCVSGVLSCLCLSLSTLPPPPPHTHTHRPLTILKSPSGLNFLESPRDLPPQHWGCKWVFGVEFRSNACKANTSATELSPQPLFYLFKRAVGAGVWDKDLLSLAGLELAMCGSCWPQTQRLACICLSNTSN